MGRSPLYALPVLTVLVVCFALLVVGAPRPYVAARLFGGPTEDVDVAAYRVEVVDREGESESPMSGLPIDVEVEAGSERVLRRAVTDESGFADVAAPLSRRNTVTRVTVRTAKRRAPLVDGVPRLTQAQWRERARREGSWLPGRPEGALGVRVAASDGLIAQSLAGNLTIEVRDAVGPVGRAALTLTPDGAMDVSARAELRSDARGRAHVEVTVLDPLSALRVDARDPEGRTGTTYVRLPVVPGAMALDLLPGHEPGVLSAAPRERVHLALLSDSEIIAFDSARLREAPPYRAALPEAATRAPWLMVSSEPSFGTATTVGWPVTSSEPEPRSTFTPPVVQLLDGLPAAFARDAQRRSYAKRLAAVFTAGALLLTALFVARSVRNADRVLRGHLAQAGEEGDEIERVAGRGGVGFAIAIAVTCIALGFAAIALFAVARLD